MQVFIIESVIDTAISLDKKRFNKQIVEVSQIIQALRGETKAWRNHPCTLQYRHHEEWLRLYRTAFEYLNHLSELQMDSLDPQITWNNDCGDNEDLFLAIAAMNYENDYMQWFVCDDGVSMFRIDQKGFSADKFVHEYMDGWDTNGYRKATVKELIEKFG